MIATVHSSGIVLAAAVFLACAVEMVEALTIVLAVGTTSGWKVAMKGTLAAIGLLTVIVAVAGPAIVHFVPLRVLRGVIGVLLLYFGAKWLRKAILRAAGLKAKHDEDKIFKENVEKLTAYSGSQPEAAHGAHIDSAGKTKLLNEAFSMAFNGVFLEGLEVVVVVLTLGTASRDIALASLAAGAAFLVVLAVGLIVARQLSEVPENAMKMAVGLMLVSFGTFWSGEGAGLHWPGSDLSLPGLVAVYGLLTSAAVAFLKARASKPQIDQLPDSDQLPDADWSEPAPG